MYELQIECTYLQEKSKYFHYYQSFMFFRLCFPDFCQHHPGGPIFHEGYKVSEFHDINLLFSIKSL